MYPVTHARLIAIKQDRANRAGLRDGLKQRVALECRENEGLSLLLSRCLALPLLVLLDDLGIGTRSELAV